MTDLSTLSLDALKPRIIEAMLPDVPFDGWTESCARHAAAGLGLAPAIVTLAFPRPVDMVMEWIGLVDEAMEAACDSDAYRALPVREKIARAIEARLDAADREVVRRAVVILGFPVNAGRAARRAWQTADRIWRLAGDSSSDFAHYTKRATLSAIYTATVFHYLDDESEDAADTRAFLGRRIAGVIRFEQRKARWRARRETLSFSPARFLGRLRYPAEPL